MINKKQIKSVKIGCLTLLAIVFINRESFAQQQNYNNLALKDVLQIALNTNHEIKKAKLNVENSKYITKEVWASFRSKDSLQFSPNFQITNQTVAYDSVLESAGNDFMCIKLQNDTLNAVWGDTRDGKLNIWFQNMAVDGTILSVKQISSEEIPEVFIYPNPTTSIINIENENLKRVTVYDMSGHQIIEKWDNTQKNGIAIDLINHSKGTYLVEVITSKGIVKQKIIKQ